MIDVEYEGNHAYCSYCGLLGHTVGLCRKKRQAQGKAPMEGTNKESSEEIQAKNTTKERTQWTVKTKSGTNQKPNQNDLDAPREILKKPEGRINEVTRQALKNVGLISDEDNEHHIHTTSNLGTNSQAHEANKMGELAHWGETVMQSQKQLVSAGFEMDLQKTGTDTNPTLSGNKKMQPSRKETGTESGVITTPTKNRFDVLDTEGELQSAFRNLQRPESSQQLILVPIPEDQEKSFSDGSGTRLKSNTGIPRNNSEPNSDEEEESIRNMRSIATALRKQRKKSSSEPKGNKPTSY